MIAFYNNKYLIEACRKGDPGAQLQVYKLFFNQMFSISLRLVNNADTADEIVNEAFLSAFNKNSSFTERVDFISRLRNLVEEMSVEAWSRNNVSCPGLITDRPILKK